MAFYRRSGVTSTGRCLIDDEGTYLVLSTQPDISSERLRQIVGKLAPMSYRPRIVDAAEAGVHEGDEGR